MAVWVLIAGLVGAKLMLVAVDWNYFSSRPRELGSILQSGGVFYGGLIGGILVAWYYARRYGLPGWRTADVLAPGVVLGQAIGRLGCFSAGCCWGKPTEPVPGASPSAMPTPARRSARRSNSPLHPSQLYESAAAFLVFALLLWLSRRKGFHGQVALAYVGRLLDCALHARVLARRRRARAVVRQHALDLADGRGGPVIAVVALYPIARRRNRRPVAAAAAA